MKKLKFLPLLLCCFLTACINKNTEIINESYNDIQENSTYDTTETTTAVIIEETTESKISKSGLSIDEYTEEYINFVDTTAFPVKLSVETNFDTVISKLDKSNYIEFPVECQNGLENGDVSIYFIFTDPKYMYYNIETADPFDINQDYTIVIVNHSDKPIIVSNTTYNSESKGLQAVLAPHAIESTIKFGVDIDENYLENLKNITMYAYELTQDNYESVISTGYNENNYPEDVNDFIEILSHKNDMIYEFNIINRFNGEVNISNLTGWVDAVNNCLPEESYNNYMNYNILFFNDSKLVDIDNSNFSIPKLNAEEIDPPIEDVIEESTISIEEYFEDEYFDEENVDNEETENKTKEEKKYYNYSYHNDDLNFGWGKATYVVILPRYGLSTAP